MHIPHRRPFITLTALALLSLLLAACGSTGESGAAPTPTPPPTATSTPEPGAFYFKTEDGLGLLGQTYGQGTTAIVLSSQDDDPGVEWRPLATQLAAKGYLVVTYNYRGVDPSQGRYERDKLPLDLRAAIQVARSKGATKIVLIGASMGGLVATKVAVTERPVALVALSAPVSYGGITLTSDDLSALTMPKFFAASVGDRTFAAAAQQLYDQTPDPRQLKLYPDREHGVDLFQSPTTKDDFLARLFAFLRAYAPA